MAEQKIARYWVGEEGGAFYAGVPARDLTQEEYDALPTYQQLEVDGSNLYRKTRPPEAKKADKQAEAEKPVAAPKEPEKPAEGQEA
jgi:hypothetical protein